MTIAPERPTGKAGDDRAVVAAVRAGAIGQFAALYDRYHAEALRIARRQVGGDEAQDLVQETFARVLRAIRNGGGPTEDVPGYIFRTLRNLKIDRSGRREYAAENVETIGPAALWSLPDSSDEVLNRGLVADAFQDLPPRWRQVLWLTEVEGLGPGELSEEMGMKPTAVSTLSLRARAGFRSAWLQAHVRADIVPEDCRPFVSRLGDYETGRLSRRRHAQVQEHLDQCDHCPALVAEMTAASERLGVLLLPVLVLAPKALWWVFGGWAVKAGFLLWGAKAGLSRLREPKVAAGSAGGVAVAGIVAAVAVATALPPDPGTEPAPAPTASAGAQPSSAPTSSSSPEPDRSAAPDQPQTQQPSAPATPAEPDRPAVPAAPPAGPSQPSEPSQQPSPPAETPSSSPESDAPTASPEPTNSPSPEPPQPTTPPAPQVTGPESQEVYTTLALSGQDALPGATITVRDDAGNEVATTTADDSGQWQTDVEYTPPGEENAGGGTSGGGTSGAGGGKSLAGRMLQAALAAAQENEDEAGDGGGSRGSEGSGEAEGSSGSDGASESDGSGGSGEPGAGMDADDLRGPARTYTVTQTVPDGESEDYTGESDPKTIGPIHWQAPEVLCPTGEGPVDLHGVVGVDSWIDVRYLPSDQYDVEFFLDGERQELHEPDFGSGTQTCPGEDDSATFAHIHGVDAGKHVLTARYEAPAGESQDGAGEGEDDDERDSDDVAAGRPVTIHFTVGDEAEAEE